MKEGCEILLEKTTYSPGEIVTAQLQCTYFSEHKVKGIRVTFVGEVKVSWNEGKYVGYEDEKQFLKTETQVLLTETIFQPGTYKYPVVFTLPLHSPSSLEAKHGCIKYKIEAVVSRPWAIDYECKKAITVFSFYNLEGPHINNPIKVMQTKTPMALFKHSGPITIAVELPKNGYAQNDAVSFVATLKNDSSVSVKEVRFRIVQGYEFHVRKQSTEQTVCTGDDVPIVDSAVASGAQDSWNLELRVAEDMPISLMGNCELITAFWKLRGEVRLPFPHNNFVIDVPIVLGAYGVPAVIP